MEIITKYDLGQKVFYLTADGICWGIIKEIKCDVSISESRYEVANGLPKKLIFDRRDISYKVEPSDKNTEVELDENKLYSTKEELKESL